MNQLVPTSSSHRLDQLAPGARRIGGARRRGLLAALAALLACAALLVLAPLAAAAGSGSIAGTASEAGKPTEGIQVYVYSATDEEFVGFAVTGASGEYTVSGLAEGSYKVGFYPSSEGEYAPQYYNEKHSLAEATPVVVEEAKVHSGISANLHVGGMLTGTVSGNGAPAEGVEVYVSNQTFFGFAATEAGGKYTVKGLPTGSYRVEFYPFGGANLVPQYFEHGLSPAEATLVFVEEEKAPTVLDENLPVGGQITGTVTNSVTHKPAANVFVEAVNARGFEFFGGFGETNANGEYTVIGLGTGTYNLEFSGEGTQYIMQSDNGIGVTQGSTTSGVNVSLVPQSPNNTSSPVASGTAAVGQTLSCANGSWSGISTISYAYKWLREGSAIESATSSSYTVQPADQGHGLSCEVTASNSVGHSSATSNTLNVPAPPPPPPPTPSVALPSTKVIVSGNVARVPISCAAAAPCSGTIELLQRKVVKHRKRHRTVTRIVTTVLGHASFALAAGHSGLFVVHLSKLGKHALDATRHHRLSILLEVSVHGGATAKTTALLMQAPVRRK